jgi:transcriptional regulator with XRE-family HTH domain
MLQAASVIRDARRAAGLTQTSLASRLGVPQSVISRLEQPGSNPTWETVARVLHVTGHELSIDRPRRATGIDDAQIRERLRLSPAERLRSFQSSQHNLGRLRRAARHVEA